MAKANVAVATERNERNVERRCPICDRGHMCFSTLTDIDTATVKRGAELEIMSEYTLHEDVWGSWLKEQTKIPAGTTVRLKNLRAQGKDLRAMVELPDGRAQWIAAHFLTAK